jgi:hypothetical protein
MSLSRAFKTEDLTKTVIEDLHKKVYSQLHSMAASFYTMGLMVGYYAARQETLDEVKRQEAEKNAAETKSKS